MAFLSKIGNTLWQSASKQFNSELGMWTNQAVRCMSSMGGSSKVFIGGVSYQTDDASLREAFGKYGDVVDARIIIDRDTGRSRGFGFVTYATPEEASSAIQALDGQDVHGRRVRVNYATERPRDNFGYGGGDGGGDGGDVSAVTYSVGGGGGYGSYNNGGGNGSNNSHGNDNYTNAGKYGSEKSYETASGGGSGNNTDFGPSGDMGTGGGGG